jgi:hypothetical protein
MDADNRLAKMAKGVKAGVAQSQGKLVFALGLEAAPAFVAAGKFRSLKVFVNLNLGLNLMSYHIASP